MLRNQKRPGSGQLKSTGASRMSALGQKQTFAAALLAMFGVIGK